MARTILRDCCGNAACETSPMAPQMVVGCGWQRFSRVTHCSTVVVQGKYEEADPLYKRAIDINEKALGPEHPEVTRSLNDRVTGLEAQVLRSFLEAPPRSMYLGRERQV